MNTSPWPQEIVGKEMEEMTTSNNSNNKVKAQPSTSVERKVRPQKEQALNCPRCNSTNTKFCYYNNYSLTQPRYFCKTCRRYWTEGGSLRNIPVGGGSRKNKRPASIAFPSSNTSKIKLPDLVAPLTNPNNSSKIHDQDLNLGCFPSSLSEFMHLPIHHHHERPLMNPNFMMMTPMHISDPNSVFPSGFTLNGDFKPALNFSLDGLSTTGGVHGGMQDSSGVNGGRILFPFDNLKTTTNPTSSTTADHQNHNNDNTHQQGDSTGYWTGILGGAGSCLFKEGKTSTRKPGMNPHDFTWLCNKVANNSKHGRRIEAPLSDVTSGFLRWINNKPSPPLNSSNLFRLSSKLDYY